MITVTHKRLADVTRKRYLRVLILVVIGVIVLLRFTSCESVTSRSDDVAGGGTSRHPNSTPDGDGSGGGTSSKSDDEGVGGGSSRHPYTRSDDDAGGGNNSNPNPDDDGEGNSNNEEENGASGFFAIKGDVTEIISPGVMVPLDLEITNAQNFPLTVTGLAVTVRAVNAPNAGDGRPCSRADFAVDQTNQLEFRVAAGASSTLSGLDFARYTWPKIGMLDRPVNQNGCKGASLTLHYAALGKRANS